MKDTNNLEENVTYCDCCGAELTGDVMTFDGEILCEDCLDERTVVCSHCGERIWNDDNAGSSDVPLCERCYDHYYTSCEDCGRVIHLDYAYYADGDDYLYCCECYHRHNHGSIHDYGYKPDPIFYGTGKRFFGVELEIDGAGKDSDNADLILEEGNYGDDERIYIKSDGSLNNGMEIVTHPMTLDYHKDEMPWEDVCHKAIQLGYKSHKTSTCGLHIHVNRSTFGETREQQDECISRVLYFVEHHWNELLKFSRRTEYQMNRWAARYGYKNNPKEIMEDAKKGANGRYACVNITNWSTIEFRMFRGTLKLNTLLATVELVDRICETALTYSDSELSRISWTDFVASLDEDCFSELITYLKERQLYVNTPIDTQEDE